jgi:hypothetical protein
MKFIPLSKQEEVRWNERVRPILDDYVKDMKAKNLPGEEALKFAQDYLNILRFAFDFFSNVQRRHTFKLYSLARYRSISNWLTWVL